jgi:pimeloyl-ACP methyl ester carboxylesterase
VRPPFRVAIATVVLLCRCATTGGEVQTVRGDGLLHRLLVQPAAARDEIHVYIEGDGTPWVDGTTVAADPTPRQPVALHLMRRDRAFSVYAGRPCYSGLAGSEGCSSALWTSDRYSAAVVSSMRVVVRRLLDAYGAKRLVLIGYSGGGTLAMLLAPSFDETVAVITVGGNLDVRAWAQWHRYLPLVGSLNPVDLPPLPARIRQLHLVAGRDQNVPPEIAAQAIARLGSTPILYSRFDHNCCWERQWPQVLRQLRALLN